MNSLLKTRDSEDKEGVALFHTGRINAGKSKTVVIMLLPCHRRIDQLINRVYESETTASRERGCERITFTSSQ
jgi:hypothetical protein